jgi:hypothetical protein
VAKEGTKAGSSEPTHSKRRNVNGSDLACLSNRPRSIMIII